jgi:hypothetical protein
MSYGNLVRLGCVVLLALLLLLGYISHRVDEWQADKKEQQRVELAKQEAAADQEAFRRLSPKEHLDKARLLLKDGVRLGDTNVPQSTIDEGRKNLDAIPPSAPESADAKLLRQKYEAAEKKSQAAKKKSDVKQAKLSAIQEEQNARDRTRQAIAAMDADPPKLEAQTVCRSVVEQNLKSPSTADFVDFSYVKYQGTGRFHIQLRIDAQNSFGAKLRNTFDCQVQCASSQTCVVMKVKEL